MSSIGNRGFARTRTQVLISLAALSMLTGVSASTSPASAFALGGHLFGSNSTNNVSECAVSLPWELSLAMASRCRVKARLP